jgi:LemA protein
VSASIVLLAVAAALVALVVGLYNRLVRLRNGSESAWSDIDVQLKRRHNLIPNLVETVKGYARHEREVLERVVQLRNQAKANEGSAESQARDENNLLHGLKSVFALAENYPDLKADRHFLELQNELALTEDRIAAARRFFNGNVRDMRNLREMFPTSIVANMFGFEVPTYFELDSEAERIVPRVKT